MILLEENNMSFRTPKCDKLPQVLWLYHTTSHSTTQETPFKLTIETDAVIPVEIGELSPRSLVFQPTQNEEEIKGNLDLLQEAREIAHVKEVIAKVKAARQYNLKVFHKKLKKGDLVLRRILRKNTSNKLTPNEGPLTESWRKQEKELFG
ncbi:hypothetical protein CR513_38189, partial [Mucuna pruriens]